MMNLIRNLFKRYSVGRGLQFIGGQPMVRTGLTCFPGRLLLAALWFLVAGTGPFVGEALARSKGTSALNFLKIGVGARQMAMGNSGVAIKADVNSQAYNPATLSDITQQEVGFMHTTWLEDISYQYIAYAYPHARAGTFGLSINYLSYGDIDGYDSSNRKTSQPSASDMAINFSYGRSIGAGLAFGFATRFIREDLDAATGKAFGLDLGTLYKLPGEEWWSNIDLGLALRNLGTKPSFINESHVQPLQLDLGMAYTGWQDRFSGTIELHKPADENLYASLGSEVAAKKFLAFRLGYRSGRDLGPGVSVGFGINILENDLQLDYAFVPFEELSSVHRAGIIYKFGGIAKDHYKRGVQLMKAKQYAKAILEFDWVLQVNPDHALATRYMQRCAKELKRDQAP